MIRKCKITYHNKFLNIIVFEFNGKEIQMTSNIPVGTSVVYVKYEGNKYSIVSKQEYDKSNKTLKNINVAEKTIKNSTSISKEK